MLTVDDVNQLPKQAIIHVSNAQLGAGAFGNVFFATDKSTNVYAVKEINHTKLKTHWEIIKLEKEKFYQDQIRSKHIVRLLGFRKDENGSEFLLLDYCNGGDLRSLLRAKREKQVCLNQAEAQVMAKKIVTAVSDVVLQQYTHRDLKPENIVLNFKHLVSLKTATSNEKLKVTHQNYNIVDNQQDFSIKLIDFGFSELIDL